MKLTETFKRSNNEENLMKRKIKKILLLTKLFSKKNKVTKEERQVNREKRNELQLIIERSRALNFNYICNRNEQSQLCFGSTLDRDVLPRETKYMSPLMRRLISVSEKCPGPGSHSLETSIIKKYPNKRGYSQLASKVPRMKVIDYVGSPPVGIYDIDPVKPIKKSKAAFGVKGEYKKLAMATPGPGSYNFFKKTIRIKDSFCNKHHLIPAVHIICTPVNNSICKMCSEIPIGDYWRNFNKKEYNILCRPCMKLEMMELKSSGKTKPLTKAKKLMELKAYEKARYCDFFHSHNGTTAALPILDAKVLKKKLNQENYLAMYGM